MQQPSDTLKQVEDLLRTGNKEDARRLLIGFLKEYPESAKGWWLRIGNIQLRVSLM
jgi:TolA-binding protein